MSDKNFMSYGDAETLMTNMVSWADTKYIQKSATEGLVMNDGSIDTSKHVHLKPTGRVVLTGELQAKTWTGLTIFNGDYTWSDGTNTYYSNSSDQYVLDKSTSTWSPKTWTGLTSFNGNRIWTDGENIYYSKGGSSDQYVLNKSTSTWSKKTWSGLSYFNGNAIWTDGDDIYYSTASSHYVLNKSNSTWSTKTWTGLTSFYGEYVWTDGENTYYSSSGSNYVLDKSTSTWSSKTWTGLTNIDGRYIWTDGENTYYSNVGVQYVLDKSTSTWTAKTWTGLNRFYGSDTWTDGDNIYYSNSSVQYVFMYEEIYADGFVKTDGTIDTNSYAQTSDLPGAATSSALGLVKPDGTTITVDSNGTISLVYLEQTVTLSTSAATDVTFTDSRFTANSCVDVATPWGIVPDDVVTASGTCTITLPKVDSAQTISVRVYLR